MSQDKAVVFLSNARRFVEKARDVPELKKIVDQAAAIAIYAKRSGESLGLVNEAQEIRIRAERRAGELLKVMEKCSAGRPGKNRSQTATNSKPKLSEIGVTKSQSSRWQEQAAVPEQEFEEWSAQTKAKGQELSSSALRKVAKKHIKKKRVEEIRSVSATETPDKPGVLKSLSDGVAKFRAIYADPPWQYGDEGCEGAAASQYATMSLKALQELDVGTLAHPEGCHLWLWTTWPMIRDQAPHALLEAWGFRWVGEFVWKKPGFGVGRWLRPATEVLILAVKGDLKLLSDGKETNAFREAPKGRHSEKPEEFYDVIEALSPGPYVELFARRERDRWMRWGNEA